MDWSLRMCCRFRALVGWIAIALTMLAGCNTGQQSSGRPEVEGVSDAEHFGNSMKQLLYEFRAKVRKRGAEAAKAELPQVLESFEGLEKRKLGDDMATYQQIVEKLKAMEGPAASGDRNAVVAAAEEIGTLADKLQGKANPEPEVE
jgi:hypothetical protein